MREHINDTVKRLQADLVLSNYELELAFLLMKALEEGIN
jgi:hypothetical protein